MRAERATPRTKFLGLAFPVIAVLGCPSDDTGGPPADGSSSGSDPTTEPDTGSSETLAAESSTGGGCVAPAPWDAPDWDDNTVEALALRGLLATMVGDDNMRGAELGTVTIDDVADLEALYTAGDPSLADITSVHYDEILDDVFAEFVSITAVGPADLIDDAGQWTPGPDGGIFGTEARALNEGGLEIRQMVDKAAFSGASFYNYAVGLTEGDIDEATIDAIAAIWGNNATLDPDDADNELDDGADYAHDMGFHAQMVAELTAAKAYAADADCSDQRDAAIRSFFAMWEQSMFARTVFYINSMAVILGTATTDDEFAEALHEVSEGIGLAAGFHGLSDPGGGPLSGGARTITDGEIEALLGALGIDLADLGNSQLGEFVENLPNFEDAQEAAEQVVIDVYGVDRATIESYRNPTPG